MARTRISAKNLGELALPSFCPRCFWLKTRCRNRLPFQMFPGVFASIDAYSKKVTNVHWERHNALPPWLREFGSLGRPVPAPHHSSFFIVDEETDIRLTGVPDEVLRRPDGLFFVIDYKTARFTAAQDSLLPLYQVQLNAYAYIGERCGFQPVGGIALVYYEPQTDLSADGLESVLLPDGFVMRFKAKLLPLTLEPDRLIPPLLREAKRIMDCRRPPKGAEGCRNCERLDAFARLLT